MFKRIGHKIILTFGGISSAALVLLVLIYAGYQKTDIYAQNHRAMTKVTEIVTQGLRTVMLAGYADIANSYAKNLKTVPDIVDIRILRLDGKEAFLDNQTISNVNQRKGEEYFLPREVEEVRDILPSNHLELLQAINAKKIISYDEITQSGESFLSFLAPIINSEDCHACHGGDTPVRGVVKLTTSLTKVERDILNSQLKSLKIAAIILGVIVLLTWLMIQRTVVRPIKRVTHAMLRVSDGDLSQKVPVFGRDELSKMANSFNRMSSELANSHEGLKEARDKLTTLILSAQEGMIVTDRNGAIVLINPATLRILQKTTEEITMGGFLNLLDDPELIRAQLQMPNDEKRYSEVNYKGRILQLQASTIEGQDGRKTGSAAIIRDITEARMLREELRQLAISDALTGLYNRRYLDTTLAKEWERTVRYNEDLAIAMFDVDHFKRFNDEHGHDTGDRVLVALAQEVLNVCRAVDVPCRYGGEEFLVILPHTKLDDAVLFAERLRRTIELRVVEGLSVTISVGVAVYSGSTATDYHQFIELADGAMYQAKQRGRNYVCVADHGTE